MVFNAGIGGHILRAAKDDDLYLRWSTICDGTDPEVIGTMAEFLEAGYPAERMQRAEEHGSSDAYKVEEFGRFGGWEDDGFIVKHRVPDVEPEEEVFFWLPREKLADYARRLHARDFAGAMSLLEKRNTETEDLA